MTPIEILDKIVQQTGVDTINLYENEPEKDEKLLIFDSNTRVCVGFQHRKEQEYYVNTAWSCGCVCFLVFNDDVMYLYTTITKDVQTIQIDVAFRDFNLLFSYVKKYLAPNNVDCFNFLCNKYLEMIKRFGVNDSVEPLTTFSYIWAEPLGELENNVKSYLDEIKQGFDFNGLHITPIQSLVRRFIAPSLIDVMGCLFYDHGGMLESLSKAKAYGFRSLAKLFVPDYVARNNVHNRLDYLLGKTSVTILDPFMWGASPVLETINELISIGFEGDIKVICYSMGYTIKGLLDDIIGNHKVKIVETQGPGFLAEWPIECDLVLLYPPYKILGSICQNREIMNRMTDMGDDCDTETIPAHFLKRSANSMTDGARVFANIPLHILHEEEFKTLRDGISEKLTLIHMEYIGDFVFSSSFVGSTSMVFAKNIEPAQYITCRCGTNTIDGYDTSVRETRKCSASSNNIDIIEYNIKSELVTTEDWAPKLQRDRILWDKLKEETAKQKGLVSLDSLFSIKSGVVTGLNKAYIIDRWEYNSLPDSEKRYFYPAVNGRTLCGGSILDEEYIFFPFSSNKDCFETQAEFEEKVPIFYSRLSKYKEIIEAKRTKRDNPWWEPAIYSKENIPGRKKFVSLLTGRKGSISLDMDGSTVQTGGYIWLPKVKAGLTDEMLFAYFAIVSSDYFWKVIGLYVPYTYTADGQTYKLTKTALDKIMIPNLKSIDKETVFQLSALGYNLLKERLEYSPYNELEYIVYNLYNNGAY